MDLVGYINDKDKGEISKLAGEIIDIQEVSLKIKTFLKLNKNDIIRIHKKKVYF